MTPVSLSPLIARLDLPADYNGEELVLGWRRVNADFTSRGGFRWPFPGQWTERLEADRSDDPCSRGLHVATNWAGASAGGVVSTVLIVAYRPSDVAHVSAGKVRVDQALVLGVVDAPALIRAGWFGGADLRGANLANANFTRADLTDANLRDANLRGADLWAADLRDADLRDADLRGANLRGANLGGANLRGANLGVADLRGANLWGADLWVAYLTGANLRDADLRDAYLAGANLRDANLANANLRDADLRGAYLGGAYLGGAYLRGASANRLTVWPGGFDPATKGVIVR